MEALTRERRLMRREFESLHDQLENMFKKDPLPEDEIRVKFKLFGDICDDIAEKDLKIREQMLSDKASEEEEDKEWDKTREFKLRAEMMRQRMEKLFPLVPNQGPGSTRGTNTGTEATVRNFKLPSVKLKKFSGELKDWLGFWAQFQKIHEDQQMSGSDKFWYLLDSLEPNTDAYEIATGYPQSNENYSVVVEALKKKFGNEDLLLQVYIREILGLVISNVNSEDKLPMKTLFLKLDSHLRALKTLNLEKADPATWLFPLVESCLPEEILINWQRNPLSSHDGSQDNPPKTRLDILMSFVEREVEIRQRIEITKTFSSQKPDGDSEKKLKTKEKKQDKERKPAPPTLSSFHVADRQACAFCNKNNHATSECYRGKRMNFEERMKVIRNKKLCFRCAGSHMKSNCKTRNVSCDICRRSHVTILCRELKVAPEKRKLSGDQSIIPFKKTATEEERVNTTCSSLECSSEVALQTLAVKIRVGNKEKTVRAFIDSGSQRSYILKSTARELALNPVGIEKVVHSLFGDKQVTVTHNRYEVKILSLNNDHEQTVVVREQERICGILPKITKKYPEIIEELRTKNVHLTDVIHGQDEIELMIGGDIYARILTGRIERLECGAVAVKTELGWTLLGEIGSTSTGESMASSYLAMSVQDVKLAKLWELDAIGIQHPDMEKSVVERVELESAKFISNISREKDGRYTVRLPWKPNMPSLPTNRDVALKRLMTETKKIQEKALFQDYNKLFIDWEKEHFIEKVKADENAERIHYLPHRPVIKDSLTTPVRAVFDASCHVGKAPSLNDCLFTGRNHVKAIPDLLQRFREKKVGFVSDIRKAFQMIGVDQADRDAMRFLWWQDEKMEKLVEYRHARVMFGATCSPFILEAVLKFHLTNLPEEKKEIGEKLFSTFYIDNCVSSEEALEDYHNFRQESTALLKDAKMDLRMWLSNLDGFEDEKTHSISVLGLQWDRKTDELLLNFKLKDVPEKVTKRNILSIVQKIYDPIGFSCPAVLPMKILLQELHKKKLRWDQELSDADKEKEQFLNWFEEVNDLRKIRIPRISTAGVTDRDKWSLHVFTDASKKAYSATVFLRVDAGEVSIQLLSAKSRVAPIKEITIPKLELLGCVIGKRLAVAVKNALSLGKVKEYYWSDSMTALAWIRHGPDMWGTFVSKQVKEIREATDPAQWRHIPGRDNPADLPSRGCSPSRLLAVDWYKGVEWLYNPEESWPNSVEVVNEEEVFAERKKSMPVELMTFSLLDTIERSSTFSKKVRVIGWMKRFLHNVKVKSPGERRCGSLSDDEVNQAEFILIRELQQKCFSGEKRKDLTGLEVIEDKNGILRVKTRIIYRDDPINVRYPMILPGKEKAVHELVREYHLKHCHAGVGFLVTKLRENYWITKARRNIKKVVSRCLRCRRYSSKAVIAEAAPLPLDRIKDAEVFEVLGVDLAGPLILKNGKKVWMVIFTCAIYRAVYLDLVHNISTKSFIGVLEKFIEKFRRPAIIYSDNGTNFRGADNTFKNLDWASIQKYEDASRIKWKFNPVTSSWWGGFWERLIRTVKDLLRKSVGKQSLNLQELKAVLKNITEVINGRPLTYVSEDPNDLEPLTPAMFLHPFGNVNFPESQLIDATKMRFRYHYVKTLTKELKDRFQKEYRALLVNRNSKKPNGKLSEGELVLVGSDNTKRIDWPLGKVLELIPGTDENCRLARVKTMGGELIRSVQRLYPLEMDSEPVTEEAMRGKIVTRSGRVVKKPARFL